MKEHIGVYYDKTSDFQQEQFDVLTGLIRESIPARDTIKSLLDIGSGTGARTVQALENFPSLERCVAAEPDWEMIQIAEESHAHPLVTYKKLMAESLMHLVEEGTEPFDAVLSNWALHWVSDKNKMFEAVNKLTKPGSFFMISTCERLPSILTHIDVYIRNEFRISGTGQSPFFYLTAPEWEELLDRHGWRVIGQKVYTTPHEVENAEVYLDHWFTASATKFMYGKHLAELSPLSRNDLVWAMEREFPSPRYEGGLRFTEDVMFMVAQKKVGS